MKLEEILDVNLCYTDIVAHDCEDALRQLSRKLYEQGVVNEGFEEAVIKRELEFPTGLPLGEYNAALPHTYPEYVNRTAISVASLKHPIYFHVMGSPEEQVEVTVVFMLAIKDENKQLDILKELIEIVIKDNKLIEVLANVSEGSELYQVIMNKLV